MLQRRVGDSAHLASLLAAPWLERALEDDRTRRLFAGNSKAVRKEATEAWAVIGQVRHVLRELGLPTDGAGATLLDVCSGKGMTALCLAMEFPRARVVMLDSNGDMDLGHCRAVDNLRFEQVDLFARDAADALTACARGGRGCIAIGMHLCGALAPRLLTLAARCQAVDAAVVCPCCLKGSLKEEVRREAARAGGDAVAQHYPVLMQKLAELVQEEGADADGSDPSPNGLVLEEGGDEDGGGRVMSVSLAWDAEMLSPKNGFVRALKVRSDVAQRA